MLTAIHNFYYFFYFIIYFFFITSNFFFLIFQASYGLFSERDITPWGDDSDVAEFSQESAIKSPSRPFYDVGAGAIIGFHQGVISPADGPRSHFYPSSSQYMLKAIQKHGLLVGFLMGCYRLQRENGDIWYYSLMRTRDLDILKLDPVP